MMLEIATSIYNNKFILVYTDEQILELKTIETIKPLNFNAFTKITEQELDFIINVLGNKHENIEGWVDTPTGRKTVKVLKIQI